MILIAGPCVIESRDSVMRIAEELVPYREEEGREFYFKASFDKANRTSIESFRGPGIDEGLRILEEVKKSFGLSVLTDIHLPEQAAPTAEVADVLQIPAFLCRQTDLLIAAAKSKAKVNIKKGQFLAPEAMKHSVEKVLKSRECDKEVGYDNSAECGIWLTERGSSFGYGNLVADMRSLPVMRAFAPVIFDATHSVQMPAGGGFVSGGDRRFVPYLARAAAAVGIDGFFFETHYDPSSALSDGPNMIELHRLKSLIAELDAISAIGFDNSQKEDR